MHLNSDISDAIQHIEAVKTVIDDSHDPKLQIHTNDSLKLILGILQDPVLRSIIQVQDSLAELNTQIVQHPSVLPGDFDINPSGELVLSVPPNSDIYDPDYHDEQRVPSAQLSPRSPNSISIGDFSTHHNALLGVEPGSSEDILISCSSDQQNSSIMQKNRAFIDMGRSSEEERPQSAVSDSSKHFPDIMSTEWTQIQCIELVNDGTGLGFGIIGARTSGVIVKTILPNGVADRDGRLISGDHILQIGDVNLHEMVSEQVASVLRQSGTHVRLVVARPIDPVNAEQEMEGSAIVPARLLSDPNELERYLIAAGYSDIFGSQSTPSTPTPTIDGRFTMFYEGSTGRARSPSSQSPNDHLELPETERFVVELTKDTNGLGITIAGYVCEKEELSGIFVKSISTGSAADLSGKIQMNDRIIEVDQQSLQGFSNHQAVEVLKKSGTIVSLCLERYLRGPKYEQLQQAIAANETKPTTPIMSQDTTPSVTVAVSMMINRSLNDMSTAGSSRNHQHQGHKTGAITESFFQPQQQFEQHNNTMEKVAQQTTKTTLPIAVVSGTVSSTRKLSQARDSLENKIIKVKDEVDSEDSEQLQLLQQQVKLTVGHLPPAVNILLLDRQKYWVEPHLTKEIEISIKMRWEKILNADSMIIIAQIRKFAPSSGLGISLEGTVDVEGGMEVRPHHYIRSILPEGPVGKNGLLRSGDELLEVNGQRLLGMNHLEVVSILKELPQDVRMVCSRGEIELIPFTEENIRKSLTSNFGSSQNLENLIPTSDRLVKAKSDGSLATTGGNTTDDAFIKLKSRSLEPLTGLAMWSTEPQIIELIKGERGLGFSILDYQDPLDPNDTLIVIRSLVPGGVAQLDGRLIPGDRLLFVNDINLENSSLDQAVQALKGAAKGVVKIGVAKPLPMTDTSINLSQNQSVNGSCQIATSQTTIITDPNDMSAEWKSK